MRGPVEEIVASKLTDWLLEQHVERSDHIVALGGGGVGDQHHGLWPMIEGRLDQRAAVRGMGDIAVDCAARPDDLLAGIMGGAELHLHRPLRHRTGGDQAKARRAIPVPLNGEAVAALQKQLGKGEVFVASRTRADDKWIVGIDPVSKVAATYLYDRKARKLSPLYVARPELQGAPLVPMHPVEIKSRDGLTLPSYLTLPRGADKNGDGKPEQAVPLVLLVHGGPWARDGHGYNGTHQWLANRGYAVLSVNFRASTGFGKKFLNGLTGVLLLAFIVAHLAGNLFRCTGYGQIVEAVVSSLQKQAS